MDISLVSVLPENLQVEDIDLMENNLFLVGNKKQKFKRKLYDKSILEQVPLICLEPGSDTRHVMEVFIIQNNLPVRKRLP